MDTPKIVQDLLDKKGRESNTIDLDAYAKGLLDMYEAMQPQSDKSVEVTRQMKILRINHTVRNTRSGIKLSDYILTLEIKNRSVSVIQENYVFVGDNDDDIDFDDMDDDEIDSINEIIDQVEIIDEKSRNRTRN